MRAPSARLEALAVVLDATRMYSRRQRLTAACRVFEHRPAAVVAQALAEGGWPLAVEAGFGAVSEGARGRYLRALRRAWERDPGRRRVLEDDLVDAREPESMAYVAALAELGILRLREDHPWLADRLPVVLDRALLHRAAARMPEAERRQLIADRSLTPRQLSLLLRAAPKRWPTLAAADAAARAVVTYWRFTADSATRAPDVAAREGAAALERAFSHPWYAFLHVARTGLIDDRPSDRAPDEAYAEHPARAMSKRAAPRDRIGYLWWALQMVDDPVERVRAATRRLDLVRAWLRVVEDPTEAELDALIDVARAYPTDGGQSLAEWVEFVDALLEAGAAGVAPIAGWPAAWSERALRDVVAEWPVRRRHRLLTELGKRGLAVRAIDLRELARTAPLDRFGAALVANRVVASRLLVSHPQARAWVRVRVTAGDLELRQALLDSLPEAFEGETKLRVAVELALRTDLTLLPRLAPLFRFVSFDHDAKPGYGSQLRSLYVPFELPKRRGGVRTVHAPVPWLKVVQRGLLEHLFARGPWPDAAHGFVAGRNVVSNAAPHVRQPLVVNVDIARFFDSTTYERIKGACSEVLGPDASAHAVVALAEICTYDGALPTGAPTSPAIGNLVLRRVDQALTKAAARRGVVYTRYADDLTFSGDAEALQLIPFARRLLRELGYELDTRKTNIFRRGRRQVVTGLVVNERPTASRTYRRRIRAAIHTFASTGAATWHGRPVTRHQLMGHIGFLAETRPEEARRLRLSLSPAPAAES